MTRWENYLVKLNKKAQGLNHQISSFNKLNSSNHRFYLLIENNRLYGYIKVGEKRLFYRGISGIYKELNISAVLDFYVYESEQRKGFGKRLYKGMLKREGLQPQDLAIDRPSFLFKQFIERHYNLKAYVTQNSGFVIYNKYFESENNNRVYNINKDKQSKVKKNSRQELALKTSLKELEQKDTKIYKTKAVLNNKPVNKTTNSSYGWFFKKN